MDFGIFIGKNDLARFLAIVGLFSFVLSLMFPLEKKKELELEIVEINSKINKLHAFCDKINQQFLPLKEKKDSLLLVKNNSNNLTEIAQIDVWIQTMSVEANQKSIELDEMTNSIEAKEGRITVLRKYVEEYDKYLSIMFWGGLVLMIIGFWSWGVAGLAEHKKKKTGE